MRARILFLIILLSNISFIGSAKIPYNAKTVSYYVPADKAVNADGKLDFESCVNNKANVWVAIDVKVCEDSALIFANVPLRQLQGTKAEAVNKLNEYIDKLLSKISEYRRDHYTPILTPYKTSNLDAICTYIYGNKLTDAEREGINKAQSATQKSKIYDTLDYNEYTRDTAFSYEAANWFRGLPTVCWFSKDKRVAVLMQYRFDIQPLVKLDTIDRFLPEK